MPEFPCLFDKMIAPWYPISLDLKDLVQLMSAVKVIGVPFTVGTREETCYATDQHNGPRAIREAIKTLTRGYDMALEFEDLGDVKAEATVPAVLNAVETQVEKVVSNGEIPFLLGGVHTFTLGCLRALHKKNVNHSLIYFDAHPDLMPHPEINYGSAMFYALKEGVADAKRMALLGIRQIERPEQKLIDQHKIYNLKAVDFEGRSLSEIKAEVFKVAPPPYYLSIDLDVINPNEAPGVGNPYPGGLNFREVLYLATELCKVGVVGVEVVQLSPLSDRDNETAAIAAALVLELSDIVAKKAKRH